MAGLRLHRTDVQAPDPAAVRADLLKLILAGTRAALADAGFGVLALAVFRHQFTHNAPYAAYCRSRGATPETVSHWQDIPAVPVSAFKAVPLVCGEADAARTVFRTSGTTAGFGRRGEHYVPDLTLYDASLRAGFRAHLLPDVPSIRMMSLVVPRAAAPDSSLGHMVSAAIEEFGADGSACHAGPDGIDVDGALESLRAAEASARPVCLLGTSFALVHLLDALGARSRRFRLAPGSRLMDTGGFKGRSRELSRPELYGLVEDRLGIPVAWCVNEYGMTEMGSQFYDTVAGDPAGADLSMRLHRGPAWVRTRATDPETLELLPDGEAGILRHWDLANLGSVMTLQTEDLGVCEDGGFRVLGRAAGAEPRGCSLATEELLTAVERRRQ